MGGRRARCAMQEGRGEQREAGSLCSSVSVLFLCLKMPVCIMIIITIHHPICYFDGYCASLQP